MKHDLPRKEQRLEVWAELPREVPRVVPRMKSFDPKLSVTVNRSSSPPNGSALPLLASWHFGDEGRATLGGRDSTVHIDVSAGSDESSAQRGARASDAYFGADT